MTTDIIAAPTDDRRQLALLKAVGLDKAPAEQRELAISIADRYGLDLMLKHIVMVEGRPYITRDGLLHIAHRSGVFDGIEVTPAEKADGYWRSTATVFRKDMTRGFTYPGRYPAQGGNAKYAEEMAIKVAEVAALRRAFDVSAPTVEERWDDTVEAPAPAPARSLAQIASERARATPAAVVEAEVVSEPAPARTEAPGASTEGRAGRCDDASPYEQGSEPCAREAGHTGTHRNHARESWGTAS